MAETGGKEMTKLKPCPFCGGNAIVRNTGYDSFYVRCENDKCAVVSVTCNRNTSEEAIEAWNTRHNHWHTGTPTEYGEYVCLVHSMKCPPVKHKTIMEWGEHCAEKQDWFNREGGCDYEVIAWFLLPPCPYGKEWDIKSPLANLKRKGRSRSK